MAQRLRFTTHWVTGVLFAWLALVIVPAAGPPILDLYVAVADSNDRPLAGLTAADFVVRVGDAEQPVTSVKLATAPISLLFVNDTPIEDSQAVRRAFQSGIGSLATRNPGAQVGVLNWQRPTILADAGAQAAKPDPFDGALSSGYGLGIASLRAVEVLKTAPGRHVVLGLTGRRAFPIDPTEVPPSAIPNTDLIATLRASKSSFWVVEIAPILSADPNEPYFERAAWSSGGWILRITDDASALESAVDRLVDILLSQYVVSVQASSGQAAGTIRVGVTRAGAKVSTAEYPQG